MARSRFRGHAVMQVIKELMTKQELVAQSQHPNQQILHDVVEAEARSNEAKDRERRRKSPKQESANTAPIEPALPKRLAMTHTKKEIKAAATETKAIKAHTAAKPTRNTAKEANKELKRLREGEFSKGTVAAAKSKMKRDRAAAKVAKEAVRVAEAQAQRTCRSTGNRQGKAGSRFSDERRDAGNGPKAEAETWRAVLRARHDLEWAQLDEELERKRRKLKERHESEMAGLEVDLEMEELGLGAMHGP